MAPRRSESVVVQRTTAPTHCYGRQAEAGISTTLLERRNFAPAWYYYSILRREARSVFRSFTLGIRIQSGGGGSVTLTWMTARSSRGLSKLAPTSEGDVLVRCLVFRPCLVLDPTVSLGRGFHLRLR